MTNFVSQADKFRHKASFTRRITRSARKGLPHLMLDEKSKAITVKPAEEVQINDPEDMWIRTEYVDLTTIESDPSMESLAEEPGSLGSFESTKTVTSKYTPARYPIFPPPYKGPEKDEPCTWELLSPSRGLVQTAPAEKLPQADEAEPMILLKGSDTVLPGSPGHLPESIPAWKWWRDVQNQGKDVTPYISMVEYAEKSARLRIPIEEAQKRNEPTYQWSLNKTMDWYSNFMDAHP